MSLMKYAFMGIASCTILALAACGKKQENGEVPGVNPDKYGCVMFTSMENGAADTLSTLGLTPDGAFKSFFSFGIGDEEVVISGKNVNCEGKESQYEVPLGKDEYVVSFGFDSSGDIAPVMENLMLPEGYSIVPGRTEVYEDAYGYFHIGNIEDARSGSYQNSYIVLKDGEVLYHKDSMNFDGACKLIILPDKSVAADIVTNTSEGKINHEVIKYSSKDSSCTTICTYSTAEVLTGDEIVALNVFDDDRLVYFTCKGVYLSDYKLKNPELLFDWHKNGVSFYGTVSSFEEYRVCANEAGDVFVLKDGGICDEYLKLSKLPDNIISVEIAGSSGNRSYSEAVFDFNVKHPEYHITIRDDFDETNLLVKMTAGEGPEMVEAGVLDVRAQKKAWESLENLVSKDTVDSLNKGAVINGSIDGELYGAASSFWIDTLVTGEDLSSWDYDVFLERIENSKNLQTITGNSLLEGKLQVFEFLFCDGTGDTYFLNPDGEDSVISRDKLEKVVSFVEQYQSDENLDRNSFDMVADKSMLCTRLLVSRPIDVYNIYYAFKDKGKIIGYPGKSGSKHYVYDSGTLFIRKNISEEKRKVVSEFLEFLFSYDEQKKVLVEGLNDSFSARDDVLNEQIDAVKSREGETAGFGGVTFTFENIDTEAVRKEVYGIMENSYSGRDWNDSLYGIIDEELSSYFSGGCDMDALADHLNNRIKIYLEERK